jgi:hypothetical protein
MLATSKKAMGATPKKLVFDYYKYVSTTVPPPAFFNIEIPDLEISNQLDPVNIIAIILFILSSLYVGYRIYRWHFAAFKFHLYMEIGDSHKRITIYLNHYPHSADFYDFMAPKFLTNLAVEGIILPKFRITWPELTLQHKLIPLKFQLPEQISISWLQAYRLNQILKNQYYVLLFHRNQHGKWALVPLQGTSWANVPAHLNQAIQPPTAPTASSLYPALHL